MSVSEPRESFPVRGKGSSSMRLTLHSAGDHNGNAFPVSSSSSSSSSSCLGQSSPESLRSLSSLSEDRADSPLDYEVFEVTLMTTKVTKTNKVTDVISKWVADECGNQDDFNDVSVRMTQMATELSESNDNSVSVYLDANSSEYHQDTWNDKDNLTLSLVTNGASHDISNDISSESRRKHGSTTPDSDATEIPADDDYDDEEEALFLSVSSDIGIQRSGMTLSSVTSQPSDSIMISDGSAATTILQMERDVPVGVADDERPKVACPLDQPASKNLSETTKISSCCPSTNPSLESKEVISPERCTVASKPMQQNISQPARAAKTTTTTSTAPKTVASTGLKSNLEAKRVSRLYLKNVKAKVGSWSTVSPPKTPSQNKSALGNGNKAIPTKVEAQSGNEGKSQRSSAGPIKMAVKLKPITGKSSTLKTKTDNYSAQPEKSTAISRTLSTSTSSLGSEMVDEGSLESPRKAAQEVPDTCRATERVETVLQSEDTCGESDDQSSVRGKPRSHSRKISSKLGPNAREQGKGTRVDKASGPAPPPGSVGQPPGQGSPRPRQALNDGTLLGEGGQNTGGGSPVRVRQTQGQSQGIPKSHSTAERASAVINLAPTTATAKSTANQQPASGSARQPAPPAVSKLPIKGLPTSLSSLSLGDNENNGTTGKGTPSPTGTKLDEWPSRSTLPVGNQSAAKTPSSSTAATTSTNTPSDTLTSANSGVIAAAKHPAMRSRALSLQARTTATGLKAPTATSHSTAKMAAASQTAAKTAPAVSLGLMKQASHYPSQRGGSARLSRLNSTVDKNKARDAPARPTNTNSTSQAAAATGGNNQNHQQAPTNLVADAVNPNTPATPALPVAITENTNTGSGITGASGHGLQVKTGSRSKTGYRTQNVSKPGVDGKVTARQNQSKEQAEKKNQAITQLRKLLVQGNKRVEALAIVIQHLFTEREETLKQKKELSLELATLRDELAASSQCCERLQKEKEEVRISLEEALKRLEEQHKEELVQLEERLRSFYQSEWDKVHQKYQEEADKWRMLMEQQVEKLQSRQDAERKNQEVSHNQKLESLKQQYETSIQELKMIQQTDLENLEKTLKETEASLSEKIFKLSAEKEALNDTLQAEEERRKCLLTDKNLKDSHTVYLEQELESLKVVLEIKNTQLHQKEKKLMEMDKLVETNVKLEECLKKVQQENEDYKARMDKHAALSNSLSPPAGSCPMNRPYSSRRCRKSPRSTSVCPWRTRSCCGSCTTVTCWQVLAGSHPPPPSTHRGTLLPSPPPHPYLPDNPATNNNLLILHRHAARIKAL
ncbi:microtubule-associated tumor suppressor 1 homolog isoform X2 [Mastacembelus armatus]|uniref:microtubule-associated tumor suppressor 1 homolog isoform X2 n=1 Tax=Mastacembelus armatus TaxID=205130 RepID=UPI000E45CF81|nr:microtubule-associated tumor suppressor 1 homolog isoform X2 [Mastacembelus armatus]